ncbi:Alpha/Beta hydrolase protein [Diplogelasinospora grovesii]|uniref:Alpha/Beta hydrolase protein n=1 Tax=Diplogelasinospora grovesii TaxID=303347 RepID=A0AAN6RZI2_9PEZI|nr:Alpha/Beta hydrolase protein [Diplogelasinospora grovesii]
MGLGPGRSLAHRTRRNAASSEPRHVTNTDPSTHPAPTSERAPFPDGVAVWHDCPEATVGICFVHGLTGNRDSTWTAHAQQEPWPKTLLPLRLPRARLLTYGYDAYVVRKSAASANRMVDHAANLLTDLTNERASHNASSRRLVFVAHSLGGLVCKEAILLSRNNPDTHLRGLFDYVIGIAFMGTPHRGSWMAAWAKIPASSLGLLKSTNKSLLAVLETESQLLESGQARFWSMVRDVREGGRPLEVTCFFEELPLPAVGRVVPKESAALEGYTAVSVHADHRNMVRFGSADDNGFKRLFAELVRWQELAGPTPSSQQAVGERIPHRVAGHETKPPVEQANATGTELDGDHNS